MPQAKRSRCQQWIFSNETIAVEHRKVFHADCRRPRALTYEERVLLYRYCWEHRVAECPDCARRLRQEELASDFLGHKTHLCPHCHTDLTESIRTHLYACGELPDQILKRSQHVTQLRGSSRRAWSCPPTMMSLCVRLRLRLPRSGRL